MQNTQVNDLVNGTGKREGFSNLVYLRKDSQVRIQEVTQAGYILVEQGGENQDMSLYGIPTKKQEQKDPSKKINKTSKKSSKKALIEKEQTDVTQSEVKA